MRFAANQHVRALLRYSRGFIIVCAALVLVLTASINGTFAETYTNYYGAQHYDDDSFGATTTALTLTTGGAWTGSGTKRYGGWNITPSTDFYGAPTNIQCLSSLGWRAVDAASGTTISVNFSSMACYGGGGYNGQPPTVGSSWYVYWYGDAYTDGGSTSKANTPTPIYVTVGEEYNPWNPQEAPTFSISAPLAVSSTGSCPTDENSLPGAAQQNDGTCFLQFDTLVNPDTYPTTNWTFTWSYEVYRKKTSDPCTHLSTTAACDYVMSQSMGSSHIDGSGSAYLLSAYPGIIWPYFENKTYDIWIAIDAICANAEICGTNSTTVAAASVGDITFTNDVVPLTPDTTPWYQKIIIDSFKFLFLPTANGFTAYAFSNLTAAMETKAPFAYWFIIKDGITETTGGTTETSLTIPFSWTLTSGQVVEMPMTVMPASGAFHDAYHTYLWPILLFVIYGELIWWLWHRIAEFINTLHN